MLWRSLRVHLSYSFTDLFKDFLMWSILKVFIEFTTTLLLFSILVFWPRGMWDLSSPTTNQTHTPCTGTLCLNHWTTREVPASQQFKGVRLFSNNALPKWQEVSLWFTNPTDGENQSTLFQVKWKVILYLEKQGFTREGFKWNAAVPC